MANVNITGFQLARRRQEEEEKRKGKELTKAEETTATEAENEPLNVDEMTTDELKAMLDKLGVKYSHNTGDAKLKERLNNAINGSK